MSGSPPGGGDRRSRRTRAALTAAFNDLVLTRDFATVSAAAVAAHANIGRSTFYEHFAGPDDLLAASLATVLAPLADACLGAEDAALRAVVDHFWAHRRLARTLLAGDHGPRVARQLAALIADRLAQGHRPGDLPPALRAVALAHGQLGVIAAWLSGHHGWSPDQVTTALRKVCCQYRTKIAWINASGTVTAGRRYASG